MKTRERKILNETFENMFGVPRGRASSRRRRSLGEADRRTATLDDYLDARPRSATALFAKVHSAAQKAVGAYNEAGNAHEELMKDLVALLRDIGSAEMPPTVAPQSKAMLTLLQSEMKSVREMYRKLREFFTGDEVLKGKHGK